MKTRILIFISLLAAIMLRNVIGQESPGGGVRPANQAEVNAGTVSNKYVSPKTLSGWSGGGGGGGSGTGTNFSGQIITNFIRKVVLDLGSTTNAVIALDTTNSVVWSPSNNCALTLSGSWVSGYRQVIDLTLVLTNGQTSVVLPLSGPGGASVGLLSAPSTNALSIVSDGTRQWIESGVSLFRPTNPAPSINGWDWNSIMDAVAVSRTGPGTGIEGLGDWVLREDFWLTADATAQIGGEYWYKSGTGTIVITNQGAGGSTMFGEICANPRTATSRWCTWLGMSSGTGVNRFTNAEILTISRLETSSLDNTTVGTNTIREGWLNQFLSESTSGVYWRSTNNVWQLVTARNSSYTVTPSLSNVVAGAAQIKATFLDATGTNVYGFIGTTPWNMVCVATNSSNIPHDFPVQPSFFTYMVLTNAAWSAGVSNRLDYMKVWARKR